MAFTLQVGTCSISNTISPHSRNTKLHGEGARTLIKSGKKNECQGSHHHVHRRFKKYCPMFQGQKERCPQAKVPPWPYTAESCPHSTCFHSGDPATLAFVLFFQSSTCIPTTGPLHVLSPHPAQSSSPFTKPRSSLCGAPHTLHFAPSSGKLRACWFSARYPAHKMQRVHRYGICRHMNREMRE